MNCVLPIFLLAPFYGLVAKLSLTSLIVTFILFVFLTINKQHLLKCKNTCTKVILIFLGVAISWCFATDVGKSNKSIPSTEVIFEVVTKGYVSDQKGLTQIVGEIIKTTKGNKHYIGKKVMLKFKNQKNFRPKSKYIIIKGILTSKKNSCLFINVNKYNETPEENLFNRVIFYFQNKFFDKVNNISKLNPGSKSFLLAITTGNKTFFDKDEISLFIRTGTIHLFAISGLHFAIIYLILRVLLDFIIKYKMLKSFIIIITLYIYLVFINESISAIRAFSMISMWEIVSLVNKKSSSLSIITIAFFFSYLLNPLSIFSVGFQLSFSIVLAIIWFFNTDENKGKGIWNQLYKTTQASVASFSGSVLILLLTFKQFVPVAIFSNILIIPLVFPIMVVCLLYCLLFIIFGADYPFFLNTTYNIIFKILSTFDINYLFFNNISIKSFGGFFLVLPLFIIFFYNVRFNIYLKSFIILFIQLFTYFLIKFIN